MTPENDNLPAVKAPQELSVDDVLTQLRKVQELMKRAMVEGEDYGVIPGTKRPTLLKPGAEKLLLMMRLDPQYDAKTEQFDYSIDPEMARYGTRVISTCTLYHLTSGNRMGSGMGACDSTERGREHVPFNTILKIANKRALVAAVLNVTGASQIFTQDMEDGGGDGASTGTGGRGGRKAAGKGTQPPSPSRPGPDELSSVQVRAAFWRTCKSQLGDGAEPWIQWQLKEVGLTDAKQLKVGQIATLYEKLEGQRTQAMPPEPTTAKGPDDSVEVVDDDISF